MPQTCGGNLSTATTIVCVAVRSVMPKIRILLTEDHTLFRQGIKTLIAGESDMEVVGEAANGADAVTRAAETRPDVVLMDIGMTGLSSFEATRQIKKNR